MGGWSVRDQPVTRPLPTATFTWQGAPRGEGLYSATIPVPSLNLKGRKPPCLQTHFWHMEGGLCEVRGSRRGEEPLCFQGLGSVLGAGPHSRVRPAWVPSPPTRGQEAPRSQGRGPGTAWQVWDRGTGSPPCSGKTLRPPLSGSADLPALKIHSQDHTVHGTEFYFKKMNIETVWAKCSY